MKIGPRPRSEISRPPNFFHPPPRFLKPTRTGVTASVHLTPLRQIKVSVLSLAIMWAPADTGTLHAVTPDDSVDKKRSKHYRRRFVSLACQNEPAAPPRSYLLLEIARVVGLLGACEQCQLEAKRVAEQRGLNRTLERGFSGL